MFKYLDVTGALAMLSKGTLQFTNSFYFNDPFDCHPSLIDFSNVPVDALRGWPADVIEDIESNRHINYRNDLWICSLLKYTTQY